MDHTMTNYDSDIWLKFLVQKDKQNLTKNFDWIWNNFHNLAKNDLEEVIFCIFWNLTIFIDIWP